MAHVDVVFSDKLPERWAVFSGNGRGFRNVAVVCMKKIFYVLFFEVGYHARLGLLESKCEAGV